MKALLEWLDHRTGIRSVIHGALYEHIPGGSRWRYVWGSTLVFAFMVQLITGIFLWMAYSPSARSAWESVYYIQFEMQGGWFLRGLHHFMAQAMVILLVLHLLQVVIDGAYRAPREINFWLGLVLMQIVLGLSLTGYLLPWDQKGFWATRVATNLMGIVPVVGPEIQKVVVGGPTYGHATLTRFFALHAGVLPAALIFFLVLHVALFRRWGIHAKKPFSRPDSSFWPDQVLKDAVACLAVLAVVVFFIVKPALFGEHAGNWSPENVGAELGAPADSAKPYSAARPEWYFLFLFQFLKYFHGNTEVYGAVVIPGLVMGMLFLMPILGRWKLGHGFNVGLMGALGLGICFLTYRAMDEDRNDKDFKVAVADAETQRARVIELAHSPLRIPEAGGVSLLRNDPKSQGPVLFKRYCASCHHHIHNGVGIESEEPSGPNLARFAGREWLSDLFNPQKIVTSDYFGDTKHKEGQMVEYVKGDYQNLKVEDRERIIAALSAEAKLISQIALDENDARKIKAGQALIKDENHCSACHNYYGSNPSATAPDLTGYGSRDWLVGMISMPAHERFYGKENDRMPSFAKNPAQPEENVLRLKDIELMADWIRGEWYEAGRESPIVSQQAAEKTTANKAPVKSTEKSEVKLSDTPAGKSTEKAVDKPAPVKTDDKSPADPAKKED